MEPTHVKEIVRCPYMARRRGPPSQGHERTLKALSTSFLMRDQQVDPVCSEIPAPQKFILFREGLVATQLALEATHRVSDSFVDKDALIAVSTVDMLEDPGCRSLAVNSDDRALEYTDKTAPLISL
jgi:hypothetical protein